MSLSKKHVLGFSPEGKLFAHINDQGILRIWDTETNELKQEYTPNLHLSGPCTSLAWVPISQHQKKDKKARKSIDAVKDALYIAMGTSTGQVSLYSYAEGKVERNLKGEGHNGKITSIVYDNNGKLYTSGVDCQVIVWSLRDEQRLDSWDIGPEKPHNIAYLPKSNSLVVGSRQIKVHSVERQELVQTFTGHSAEINFMCTFVINDSIEYAITTSRMERIICLWKIGKKGRNKTAACTLLMEDIAHCLTCQVQSDGMLRVASVTRSGVIHIYLLTADSMRSEKPIKPKVTLEIASDSESVVEPIPAVCAHLQYNSSRPHEILFGYGDKRLLVFERLSPNYKEKMNVLVRSDPKKLYATKDSKQIAGSDNALKTLTPIINYNEVDYKSSISISKKSKQKDVPMESRLQNLNLNGPTGTVTTNSQSKVQLLVQALHSKDSHLLRSVLCIKDLKTVQMTLQRLPVQYVGTLVNELTLLMQMKRVNVEYALLWLKVLTQTHASQLLALGVDDLLNKFGPCLGIIEHRANCLKEVSKLNGRLNLLISQIKQNTEDDILNEDNVLVFEDNDPPTPMDETRFGYKDTLQNWSDQDERSEEIEDDDDINDDDDVLEEDANMELDT